VRGKEKEKGEQKKEEQKKIRKKKPLRKGVQQRFNFVSHLFVQCNVVAGN